MACHRAGRTGRLVHETELSILEHTTDTAGFTELVFVPFDLLGIQFAPRIRDLGDLGDQRLYRFDPWTTYRHLGPLPKGKVRERQIVDHRDDLLRGAGSLKRGHVTAPLLIEPPNEAKWQAGSTASENHMQIQVFHQFIVGLLIKD